MDGRNLLLYLLVVLLFSSLLNDQTRPLSAHGYVINIYDQVAYNSYPAGFGKFIPRNFHDGAFVNLFLPPKEVLWDLCNVDDYIRGLVHPSASTMTMMMMDNFDTVNDTVHHGTNSSSSSSSFRNTDTTTTTTTKTTTNSVPTAMLQEDDTTLDVTSFFDKCPKGRKLDEGRTIMTHGIQRTSMALLVMRGGCTFYTKAVNALKLNAYFAIMDAETSQSPSSNHTNNYYNDANTTTTTTGTYLDIRPKIEYLIIMNSNNYKRSNRTFPIGKDGSEPDLLDIGLVSLGYSNGLHLLCSMFEKNEGDKGEGGVQASGDSGQPQQPQEEEYSDYLGTDMFLDRAAFLPLESDQRTTRDWMFPVNIDGMTVDGGSMKNKLLLIFIIVTLLFPIARMLLFCCMHHREFQWRRNENGRITGFTWSRRIVDLDNDSWIGSLVGVRNGTVVGRRRTSIVLLSEEGVKNLPMIEYGVDNVQDVVARYRQSISSDWKEDETNNDNVDNKSWKRWYHNDHHHVGGRFCNDNDDIIVESQDKQTEQDLIVAAYGSCITCSICICDFEHGEKLRLLPECGHVFHTECIMPWLTGKKNSCPLCQRKVKASDEDMERGEEDTDTTAGQMISVMSLMSGQVRNDHPPINISGSLEQSDAPGGEESNDDDLSTSTMDLSNRYQEGGNTMVGDALSSST